MKLTKSETYDLLIWWLCANDDILWAPTFRKINNEVFTDDEQYGFLVVGPGLIRLTEYNGDIPEYTTIMGYSDLTSCLI